MNLKCLIQGAINTSMIAQQVTQVKTVCCRATLSRSSTSVYVRQPQVILEIIMMVMTMMTLIFVDDYNNGDDNSIMIISWDIIQNCIEKHI